MIEVKRLVKVFNGCTVLDDVSIKIEKSECVFIYGPSGAGKSTFLRCLNLLERPASGDIVFAGQNILSPDCDVSKVRQRMGMVCQEFDLFTNYTVLDNITLAPIKLLKKPAEEAINEGCELLERFGIWDKIYSLPCRLSGGQRQCVAIIRALMMSPDVILFDEPTSALDNQMQLGVRDVVRDLCKSGVTIVGTTHNSRFAESVATRMVQMEGGRLV
ncbi:MAG: ATP-binding cassette domain-containing protein [Oscillospiraceae bacterium]|nr:ATP-binding cassette domain-containing protein [Oscillospiraceae bacterium]